MLPANCLLSIFTDFYLMRIQVTWVFIINLHESILMPITERASSKYYTMAPDSDILYLYWVSAPDANGRLVNSSAGVGNDKTISYMALMAPRAKLLAMVTTGLTPALATIPCLAMLAMTLFMAVMAMTAWMAAPGAMFCMAALAMT